jgi:hypothetical protein
MVVGPVLSEPVSEANSLIHGKIQGNSLESIQIGHILLEKFLYFHTVADEFP